MDSCHCVCLGQSIVPKVGKSFKLILVDLFDYTVVHWCQDRLFTCEILVEVIHIPFGFLETRTQYVYFSPENMTAADTSEARFANPTATVSMGAQTHDAWLERWSDLPLLQQCPVNLSEERMKLDGLFQSLSHNAPQTFVGTLCHELKSKKKKKRQLKLALVFYLCTTAESTYIYI